MYGNGVEILRKSKSSALRNSAFWRNEVSNPTFGRVFVNSFEVFILNV